MRITASAGRTNPPYGFRPSVMVCISRELPATVAQRRIHRRSHPPGRQTKKATPPQWPSMSERTASRGRGSLPPEKSLTSAGSGGRFLGLGLRSGLECLDVGCRDSVAAARSGDLGALAGEVGEFVLRRQLVHLAAVHGDVLRAACDTLGDTRRCFSTRLSVL